MFEFTPSALRRLACLNAFAFSGAQGLLLALYPFVAYRLGLDLSFVVGSFSLGSLLFLFGTPFWARLSDQRGRLVVLRVGLSGLFVSFVALAGLVWISPQNFLLSLSLLLASRVTYGLTASSIAPVSQSLQADLSGNARSLRPMLIHSMSLNLGRVAGFSLVLVGGASLETTLALYAGFLAVVLGVNFLAKEKAARIAAPSPEEASAGWIPASMPESMPWVFALAFLFTMFIETLNSSLGGLIQGVFKLDSAAASGRTAQILCVASLGIFVVQGAVRAFRRAESDGSADRFRTLGMVAGVLSLFLGGLSLHDVRTEAELWGSIALLTLGLGLIPPLYLSLLAEAGPRTGYGRRAGTVGVAHTLGYACGGLLTALLFRLFALPPMGWVLAALSLGLGLAYAGFSLRRPRPFSTGRAA